MKRGFIYSADGQHSQRGAGHQNIHSRPQGSFVSPRKRKRSPEPLHHRSEAGTSGAGRGLAVGRRPKITRKVGEDPFEEEDDLDQLGTAALEQYELTQREHSISPSPIPGPFPVSPFRAPIPASSVHQSTGGNVCGSANAPNPNPILSGTQKWGNPYQSHTNQPQQSSTIGGAPRNESTNTTRLSPPPSADLEVEKEKYAERIRHLQEQNYTKDGEVKVLRNEKQRLVGELKKREEQMHELHTRLLSEQKTKEQQLSKDKESLSTQLQFKEQEVLALRQKCALLEQKQRPSLQPSQPVSPVPSSVLPQIISSSTKNRPLSSSKEAQVCFLSTETFMPLSQMASTEVTPVQVGQKRSSQEGGQDFAGNGAPKLKSTKRSPTVEARNSVHTLKKDIAAPTTSATPAIEPSYRTELSSVEEVRHPSQKNTPLRDHIQESDPPVVLKVPNKELDGAQLLMLLIQHDLLKVPEFVSRDLSSGEDQSASEQQPDTLDDEPSEELTTKLTGLLSLLNLRQQNQDSLTVFPNILTTPVSADESGNLQDSFTSYKVLNPKRGNAPNTPVRKLNIRPPKPHTCGRTDISKTRSRQPVAAPVKALSASNTPVHLHSLLGEDATTSLASSIDRSELEKNIASFLRCADSSKFSQIGSSISAISPISFPVVTRSPDPSTVLVHQIGDIIIQYHSEQLAKAKASTLNASGLLDVGETMDSSSVASPKSSVGSTISSKTSSELLSPPKADQDLASQALELLEILVTYSRAVRELILMQLPKFSIDSRSSSAMGFSYQETENSSMSEGESMAVEVKENSRTEENADKAPHAVEQSPHLVQGEHSQTATPGYRNVVQRKKAQWKGIQLVQMKSSVGSFSGNVWSTLKQSGVEFDALCDGLPYPTPLHQTSRGCGQLFTVLLELPAPPWREAVENTVMCLKILSALAEDCSSDTLTRFSPLLEEETIGICLDKEDTQVTLAVLNLLTHIVKSPTITSLLCSHQDPCIPLSCYQCLLEPPHAPSETMHRIRIQLVRMFSNILVVSNGPATLLESCSCSFELLKTLVALLNQLVQDVFNPGQLSPQDLILVRETVLLIHKVSIHDRFFDTHRENCDLSLVSVLNTLSWLLEAIPGVHEVTIVKELLEYCEETEDSSENSELQET